MCQHNKYRNIISLYLFYINNNVEYLTPKSVNDVERSFFRENLVDINFDQMTLTDKYKIDSLYLMIQIQDPEYNAITIIFQECSNKGFSSRNI